MIHLAIIAALLAAPAIAATVEDPDSPRFAEGLRVLGMRDQVEVVRIAEVAAFDAEPLYLARSPDREAVFRAGEDLCMAEGKLGHFVACNRDLKRAVDPDWLRPIRAGGVTVWPSQTTPRRVSNPGGWTPMLPVVPANPDPPAPIPLPATVWLLLAALLATPVWQATGRLGAWFSAERGTGPGKNGWV